MSTRRVQHTFGPFSVIRQRSYNQAMFKFTPANKKVAGWIELSKASGKDTACQAEGEENMSRGKLLVGLVVLVTATYMVLAPYITVHEMKVAAENRDGEALSEYIDFPSLRQSLKDQMNAMIVKRVGAEAKDNPFAALGAAFAGVMVDKMVDAYVTPAGIFQMMGGQRPSATSANEVSGNSIAQNSEMGKSISAPQFNRNTSDSSVSRKPFAVVSTSYESLSKFVVTVKDESVSTFGPETQLSKETKFVLRRRGFSWKLTEIVFPLEPFEGPAVSKGSSSSPSAQLQSGSSEAADCLKIESFDSSVLSRNSVFVELAWKADVNNKCERPFEVQVRFAIYDSDEFELDHDTQDISIGPREVGKARGKMLVSPIEKANRMARQGANLRVLNHIRTPLQ